ncbi:Zinc finger MYM-type protein [Schistosoma japonicum]|nr:Zinc finger MYM-type protein [Schistosoma japonicum]
MDISLSEDNILTSELDDQLAGIPNSHPNNSVSSTHVTNSSGFTTVKYFNTNVATNELSNVIAHALQHGTRSQSNNNNNVLDEQDIDDVGDNAAANDDNLFDDLSAAIEAINEANRLNSACGNNDIDGVCDGDGVVASDVLSSSVQQNVPAISTFRSMPSSCHFVTHPIFANIPTSATTIDEPSTNHQLTLFKCDTDGLIKADQYLHENENLIEKPDLTEEESNNCTSSTIPSLMTISSRSTNPFQSSWRLLLRPIFEKALIERLWTSGELGSSNPHSLLLSMWFYISRHFGIGCRTDHAKLAYGNIVIGVNSTTGERHLQFTSLPHGAVSVGTLRKLSKNTKELASPVKPRQPDNLLPECLTKPDRCPVRLFEAFCSHRPCSSTSVESPFYLQPERCSSIIHASMNNPTWFTSNALGKNKIGSMLNCALQNIGMPVGRQVNLGRFCDALIAAAFSHSGGNVGEALRELLLLNCRPNNPSIPESILPSITVYAESIVQMSTTPNSPVYTYLTKVCSMKAVKSAKKASIKLTKISSKLSYSRNANTNNRNDNNHSTNFTGNLLVTTTNGSINRGVVCENHLNPLSSSLSTPSQGSICINSKPTNICYSDSRSFDDDDGVDDVAIDSLDLDNSNSPVNNNLNIYELESQSHNSHIKMEIDTTNHNNNNSHGLTSCLPKVKFSLSQENLNVEISQGYPFSSIIPTNSGEQSLFDISSDQLIQQQREQYSHFQQQQQQLNNSTELLFTSLSYPNGSTNISSFSPAVIFVPTMYTTAAGNNRMEFVATAASTTSSSLTISPPNVPLGSSISAALPLDENMIDISRLGGIENLIPATVVSSSTPIKQSSPENIISQCLPAKISKSQLPNRSDAIHCQPNDDIRIDLRKTGGGSGRSVKLELRELLDLVLAAAARTPNSLVLADSGKIYSPHPGTSQRPPVGLVTQLLWRARALDDRGPWILTFAMWWLMQHYFGIGSRMHHVRLRWGHLRLVSGIIDPLTGELCEAIEYVGPSAFTTVKACALLESSSSSQPIRRVYPSSGWGEAEIAVAAALASEHGPNRPKVRPLDIDPTIPPIPARSGPDFVSLYKSFARHRQQASLLPEAPFYVQPLQSSATNLHSKAAIAWFSVGALGKNRIGALMRNIVDKVVRPDMSRVATAALSAATSACVIAADRAALALSEHVTSSTTPTTTTSGASIVTSTVVSNLINDSHITSDINHRQQSLVDKLSCLLGTNMSSMVNTRNDILFTSSSSANRIMNSLNTDRTTVSGSNTIAASDDNCDGNTVVPSRLDSPETNMLLSSAPTQRSSHSDIFNANNQLVLKMPKLVQQQSVVSTGSLMVNSNNISLSSMIAPLSCKLSPLSSSASSTLADFRNQLMYETSPVQQLQQQPQSLLAQPLPQQHQQTFIQETDRIIINNPISQLATNSLVLLTTVDGHTFLAPYSSIYPTPTTATTTSQPNSYILMPNNPTATSVFNTTSNLTLQQSDQLDPIMQLQSHKHSVCSLQENAFILSGSGNNQSFKTQNSLSTTPLVTSSTSLPTTITTSRAPNQPVTCHLIASPTITNNTLPVGLILLSTSIPSNFPSSSPLILSATLQPQVQQSCNLQTIYQADNRLCDFDFDLCSAAKDVSLVDSLPQLVIQRNDSNIAAIVLNTNSNTSARRTATLMNSTNPISGINSSSNSINNMVDMKSPKVSICSTETTTTTSTTTLPACNQIFYERDSLQQHEQRLQSPIQFFETSEISDHQRLTASSNAAAAAAALLHVSPMKSSYSTQNSIVQALSYGQLITITQPSSNGDHSNTQSQFPSLIEAKLELPSLNHNQIQQHSHLTSSNLMNGQPIITFLPINNNHLFNYTAVTTLTTNTTTTTTTSSDNNNKSEIYFEIPVSNRDLSGSGQTVYRLVCTENSSREIISNETPSNNENAHLIFSNDTINSCSDNSNNLSNAVSILTSECSSYPSSLSSTDHCFMDHFPSMISRHLQSNSYSFLSIPASCLAFPTLSSSSSSAVSALSSTSVLRAAETTLSVPLLSSVGTTLATTVKLEQSKNSLITTSNVASRLQPSQQVDNDINEIHVDTMNSNMVNTNGNTSITTTTTNCSIDRNQLITGHQIKIDDSHYSSPSVMMTSSNTTTPKEHYHDMHTNNSNTNGNNHLRNNSLLTLPSLSSMTCHLVPVEPKPDQLKTLQSVINSASAFQCSDFPAYVEQLFRKGILSGRRPWCLNFTAWFINTLVFEVENRTEHVSLRWGDFRLCQTADGQTEYIYFINRITNKRYYLAGSPTSCCALGYKKSEFDSKSIHEPPVRCPCPVTIFKELRDRRPSGCLDPYSKFYLQPRNVECPEANDIEEIHDKVQKCHLLPANSNWFTEHAWGKNKLGGLFAEASKLAGLPTIWLRKHRSRNFFPGGGGSGIGALGNLHHHNHNQYFNKNDDNNNDNNADSLKSSYKTIENVEPVTITSKENAAILSTTHTENKRRRLTNSVKDLAITTTATTSKTMMTVPTTAAIIGTINTTITADIKNPNIVNSVNMLPSSMTILKPKEVMCTSTVS